MNSKNDQMNLTFAVVSESESESVPYPCVYVNNDGTVRELHASERKYLETPFHPADGARPYVKDSFKQKDGWGDIKGFCLRSVIPSTIKIDKSPLEDPAKLAKLNYWENQNKMAKDNGFEVINNADGTVTYHRVKEVESKFHEIGLLRKLVDGFIKRK
jgi:hypothetical protein